MFFRKKCSVYIVDFKGNVSYSVEMILTDPSVSFEFLSVTTHWFFSDFLHGGRELKKSKNWQSPIFQDNSFSLQKW